ncbi:UNVERIFIED_ORG: hypothetical protein GGD51_005848 [Rhizobium esperanzae]
MPGNCAHQVGLEPEILAGDDRAAAGEIGARLRHVIGQLLDRRREDGKRKVMFPENEAIGFEIVHRLAEFLDLRSRLVAGADHLVLLAAHDRSGICL